MRTELQKGYILQLPNKVCGYEITELLGRGASCFVYLARYTENDVPHEVILKEYHPKSLNLDRDSSGALCVPDDCREKFDAGMDRFEQGYKKQAAMRLNSDMTNATTNIQGIHFANGTRYIEMTLSAGTTYRIDGQSTDSTLHDFLRRMRSLATVIGYYHEAGYLHLDIKPDNIFAPKSNDGKDVILFDFDSMVEQRSVMNSNTQLSYTKEWAAMEQLNPAERSSICAATDIFSVGEMIFYRIFGRHSQIKERRSYSSYTFDHDSDLFRNVNPRIFPHLNDLLKKTLCNVVKGRYQSTDELIEKLNELIKLSDPKEPYLISSSVTPKSFFIGREDELTSIHNGFQENDIQFLSGIGGIGKSELAKNYAKLHTKNGDYDTVLFGTYNGSWMMLLNDDNSIHIANFGRFPDEKEPDYYDRKIRRLRELIDKRTLFIIDNLNEDEFEGEKQKQWEDILGLGCKLLITTRKREWSHAVLDVNALSQQEHLVTLFQYHCPVKTEDDLSAVQEIIDYVGGHTLTIELVARQTKASFLTPAKMLVKLKEHGISQSGKEKVVSEKDNQQSRRTAFEHITALFDIADLNEQEKYVLANMSLIPLDGIKAERFAEWCELEDYDAVNSLIGSGWLNRDEDIIKMHPVVAEVAAETCFIADDSRCDRMLSNQSQYIRIYTAEQQYTDVETTRNDVEFFISTANKLVRTDVWKENIAALLACIASFVGDFGHLEKAKVYLLQALEISRKLFGNEHPKVARYLNNLGTLHQKAGNVEQAEVYYLQALEIWKKLFSNEHTDVAACLNNLGNLYRATGDVEQAEAYLLQALEVLKKLFGTEHPNVARCLNNLGVLYQSTGNLKKAEQHALQVLELYRKLFGEEHPDVAMSLNNLGSLYQATGNVEQAEVYYLQALEIWKKLFGTEHPDVAQCLNNLGSLYQATGNVEQAEAHLLQALEIWKKLFGTEHPDVARCLNNLGVLYQFTGNLKKAEQYALQVLELYRKLFGEEHPDVAMSLNNLGSLYQATGNVEQAEAHLLQALEVLKKLFGTEHPNVARCLINLGNLYQATGNVEQAEVYFLQALEIQKKLFGTEHPDVATCLNNLGGLYQATGDVEQAEAYLLQALEIRKKLFGTEHPNVARCLNNLGVLYQSTGNLKQAEVYFLQALEIWKKLLGTEHPNVAACFNNLGTLYFDAGDLEQSEEYLLQALEIWKKLFGTEHPDVATCLNNLGLLYQENGDVEQAEVYFLQALEIWKKLFGTEHPNVAACLYNLGSLYQATGDLEKSAQYLSQAKVILEKNK